MHALGGAGIADRVGPHTLVCGKCEEEMERLQPASFDVVCTSPPYNLKIRYASHEDDMPEPDYLDWFAGIARQVARVMKPRGSFFLNVGASATKPWLRFSLPMRLRELEDGKGKPLLVLQNHIEWIKSITVDGVTRGQFKPLNTPRFLNHTHEQILHFTLAGDVPLDRLAIGVPYAHEGNVARFGEKGRANLRCRGNSWFLPYETVQARAEKFDHPATFPLALPQWCIRLHGVPGAAVLDPFSGVGTTALAAHLEGGAGYGIEKDPLYHAIAVQRLKDAC